jgi:hypothetical protein
MSVSWRWRRLPLHMAPWESATGWRSYPTFHTAATGLGTYIVLWEKYYRMKKLSSFSHSSDWLRYWHWVSCSYPLHMALWESATWWRSYPTFLGMHRISGRPDIRPDNPAFLNIRYPAGYHIACRISGRIPDIRPDIRLMFSWSNNLQVFLQIRQEKMA